MRAWIMAQGFGLYMMICMAFLGLLGCIAGKLIYGRLVRETKICGTSVYPMLQYIKQKYSSYYKLGIRPKDASVIVKRYLAMHRVGLLPLNAYRYIAPFMSGLIVLSGLVMAVYHYQKAYEAGPSLVWLGTAAVLALCLQLIGFLLGVDNQYKIAENALCDYLENYLKGKLDGDYGYSKPVIAPEQYESVLKETAASKIPGHIRHNRKRQQSVYSEEVDAKIVEDVLKEFLC